MELAPTIQAIIILDSNGRRLCAKYFSQGAEFSNKTNQTKFESEILAKSNRSIQRSDNDVLIYNNHLVLYVSSANVRIFVVASSTANELVVDEVLRALESALTTLLKGQIDTRGIIDNMDYVLLAMDEVCEDGIIFETEGDNISKRVLMKDISTMTQETLFDAYHKARDVWLK
eukprot:CAMPEP_0202703270 /NCGR_PEP_ID=MMETSP1385-20130828/16126_1 /ASSEMBLY_ACC=CAM_ASM_000861 /TAXON_ID=933848 /ORGANISM="Elphidium margaritaceum" /LENGTH=172 /DNA_ID=CAMNT_0049361093 /DNA_START=57 /DNA_END=575 /DNA_ORIENTATION=+